MKKHCKKQKDDLIQPFTESICNLNFKLLILVFILFILVNYELFDKYIMKYFSDTMYQDKLTSYGLVIKGIIFVLLYVIADVLVENKIL